LKEDDTMKMILGGEWVDRDEKIDVLDPQDDSLIDKVPSATSEDVRIAFDIAEMGAVKMKKLSSYDRYKILLETALKLEARLEEFSILIAREGVKTIREARKEVRRAVSTLTFAAEEAKRITGEVIPIDADFRKEKRFGYWLREPVGIVLAITPYNDPLNMVAHKLAPAIAAGNAVVLKPTYLTPLSALNLGELLLESGLPKEALSIVTGYSRKIGDALVKDERPRVITFTGGVEAGREIARRAGIKKLCMELGSSSAVIVLEDCQIDLAVQLTVSGAFSAAGQNCIGVQRMYIERKIYERYMEEFVNQTKKLKVGNKLEEDTDVGPMITKEEAERVESWVNEALDMGGRLLAGGERKGSFYLPTVLENVPEDAKVVREEIFGPVVVAFPVNNIDEAIEKTNKSIYGLHAAIFTRDIDKALYASKELRFGGIMVNDSTDFRVDYMPFGGFKLSGMMREGLKFAVDLMTEKKMVIFNLEK